MLAHPLVQQCFCCTGVTARYDLIVHPIPRDLPAKSQSEEKKHQKMYEQMVAAARKKGECILSGFFFVADENYTPSHISDW